jgi:hypothetical protein
MEVEKREKKLWEAVNGGRSCENKWKRTLNRRRRICKLELRGSVLGDVFELSDPRAVTFSEWEKDRDEPFSRSPKR